MLEIKDITKKHGDQTTLREVQLQIDEGEFFSLLGPSGCGKTTLLRLISGTERPTSGEIYFAGQRIDTLAPQERPFNMVFQSYALFPHLNVFENVAFGLRLKKSRLGLTEKMIRQKVEAMVEMVHLEDYLERMPGTLSGGQCQRVALARALVNEPRVLLLDEPLSALDAKMREVMQRELRALQQKLGITFIFVTHDQEEALTLSDRIAVMNQGKMEQICHPRELYETPRSAYVARFIGANNEISGRVSRADTDFIRLEVEDDRGDLWQICGQAKSQSTQSQNAIAFIRPEKIRLLKGLSDLSAPALLSENNCLDGTLTQLVFRGQFNEAQVDCGCLGIFRIVSRFQDEFEIGERVRLQFSYSDTYIYHLESEV